MPLQRLGAGGVRSSATGGSADALAAPCDPLTVFHPQPLHSLCWNVGIGVFQLGVNQRRAVGAKNQQQR